MTTKKEQRPDGAQSPASRARIGVFSTVAGVFFAISAIASVNIPDAPETDQEITSQISIVQSQEDNSLDSQRLQNLLTPSVGFEWSRSVFEVASNPVLVADNRAMERARTSPEKLDLAAFSMIEDAMAVAEIAPNVAPEAVEAPKKRGQAHWRCLAEAIYFEARSESERAQRAVAEVILNRVDSRRYPGTVCEVINQGANRKHRCQFSYNCDGVPERIAEPKAWKTAKKIAREMVVANARPLTDGATHYHATSVRPQWSRKLTRTAKYGSHIFYREGTRISSN